jgi:hypothetical protein
MSEENLLPVVPVDPSEGFDRAEPSVGAIVAFAAASLVLLVITIFAIQAYFEHIWNEAVYEKVLAPPSELLQEVRGRDDWNLTHYMYMDKTTGQVRIPIDRAMDMVLQDAAAGKTFYPAKDTSTKKDEPQAVVAAAPAAGAAPSAAPAEVKK